MPEHIVGFTDTSSEYPPLLYYFDGHPEKLRAMGDLSALTGPFISVVGSRQMTEYGQKVARQLIPPLVRSGLTVVSGLAYGIDSFVHRLALEHGGRCVAVLGSGLQNIYPEANRALAGAICSRGCLLSEYSDSEGPKARYFPERNRIVAGISPLTLIIEAGGKSGTLITARMALNAGREVCVVPGDITSPLTEGIHTLLGEGAKPVRTTREILDMYGFPEVVVTPTFNLTADEQGLYALIPASGSTLEHLQSKTLLTYPVLQSRLASLELKDALYFRPPLWLRT